MDEIKDFRDRLRRLESRSRWVNSLACVTVLVLGASLVIGQAPTQGPGASVPDEIRAKRFVVVDDDGDCRASLSLQPSEFAEGGPVPGHESVVFSLGAKNSKTAITMQVMHYGTPRLWFEGEDGRSRLAAGLFGDGTPCMWFIDKDHKERLKILLDKEGKPRFLSKDKDGKETALAP